MLILLGVICPTHTPTLHDERFHEFLSDEFWLVERNYLLFNGIFHLFIAFILINCFILIKRGLAQPEEIDWIGELTHTESDTALFSLFYVDYYNCILI